jgi:hypothetical protein
LSHVRLRVPPAFFSTLKPVPDFECATTVWSAVPAAVTSTWPGPEPTGHRRRCAILGALVAVRLPAVRLRTEASG